MEDEYIAIDQNTNDLQFGGSCTAHAIGNASEISYYSELDKIKINMNLFWQWREDEKGISVNVGSSLRNTHNLLKEFELKFGGIPMEFVEGPNKGARGLVRVPRMYSWSEFRGDFSRPKKCAKETSRKGGSGVIIAIPVNSDTFSECKKGGDGFLKFTGDYSGAHAMCIEGYKDLKWRDLTIRGVTKRVYCPKYFIIGNSWGETWGHKADGTTKLKLEDYVNVFGDTSTMLDWDRDENYNLIRYETVESALEKERIASTILIANSLTGSKFKEKLLDFYL